MTKEIELTVTCFCGFWKQRVFHTNEHGYFEIPNSYCPNCFNILTWTTQQLPVDSLVGVEDEKDKDETKTE